MMYGKPRPQEGWIKIAPLVEENRWNEVIKGLYNLINIGGGNLRGDKEKRERRSFYMKLLSTVAYYYRLLKKSSDKEYKTVLINLYADVISRINRRMEMKKPEKEMLELIRNVLGRAIRNSDKDKKIALMNLRKVIVFLKILIAYIEAKPPERASVDISLELLDSLNDMQDTSKRRKLLNTVTVFRRKRAEFRSIDVAELYADLLHAMKDFGENSNIRKYIHSKLLEGLDRNQLKESVEDMETLLKMYVAAGR